MKFQASALLAILAATAECCMQFGAQVDGNGQIRGAIVDNGRTTCEFNVNIRNPNGDGYLYAVCVSGFAAWVSTDLHTLAYANGGNNYRFSIGQNGDRLSTSAFCK